MRACVHVCVRACVYQIVNMNAIRFKVHIKQGRSTDISLYILELSSWYFRTVETTLPVIIVNYAYVVTMATLPAARLVDHVRAPWWRTSESAGYLSCSSVKKCSSLKPSYVIVLYSENSFAIERYALNV